MTNEEAIEILSCDGNDISVGAWDIAIRMAIESLKNQERMKRELKSLDGIADTCDKLERALRMSCKNICEHEECFDVKNADDDCETSDCVNCWVDYYKGKAGIKDDDDD